MKFNYFTNAGQLDWYQCLTLWNNLVINILIHVLGSRWQIFCLSCVSERKVAK